MQVLKHLNNSSLKVSFFIPYKQLLSEELTSRVPQGTIPGPLAHCIYVAHPKTNLCEWSDSYVQCFKSCALNDLNALVSALNPILETIKALRLNFRKTRILCVCYKKFSDKLIRKASLIDKIDICDSRIHCYYQFYIKMR